MTRAAPERFRGDGWTTRCCGQRFASAGAGWSALSLLSSLVGVAAQEEGEGAVSIDEEEEGAPNDNSNIAQAVEQWLPLFLGLVLVLAVVGWCAMNVYRASRLQAAEEALAAAEEGKAKKVPGNSSISAAPSRHSSIRQQSLRHPSYRLNGERGGGGTGDVSPDVDRSIEPKRSLRGSAVISGNQHGALAVAGGGALIPALLFEGDELQGKKAPGEQGDVYQNPMQRTARKGQALTPDTSDASHSSASIGGRKTRTVDSAACHGAPFTSSGSEEEGNGAVRFNATRSGRGNKGAARGPSSSTSTSTSSATADGRRGGAGGRGRDREASSTQHQKRQSWGAKKGRGRGDGDRRKNGGGNVGGGGGDDVSGDRPSSQGGVGDSPDGDSRACSQADFARSLPPAVLRAARPIPRNPSSSAVERTVV